MASTKTKNDAHSVAAQIASECVGQRARQLNRLISRLYDDALRPHGVKNAQLAFLTAIQLAGPLRPGELAKLVGAEKSTVTRNVRVLIDRGWVHSRELSGEPGKTLRLTAEGRELLVAIFPAWREAQGRALEMLGPKATVTLGEYVEGARNH